MLGRYVNSRKPNNSFRQEKDIFYIDSRSEESFDLKKTCTGCGACESVCPKNAINMKVDAEGFAYPSIDNSLCIDCGLCNRVCPVKAEAVAFHTRYFAARNRNEEERIASSSGGIFILIARAIIEENGVVFGAAFDDNNNVHHIEAVTMGEVKKLMGSKYVQSKIGSTYKKAKDYLEEGRPVLFTGTPCQIAGLKAYLLGKEYGKLMTVDVICHGTPSYMVLSKYLQEMNISSWGGVNEHNILSVRLNVITQVPQIGIIAFIPAANMVRQEQGSTFLAWNQELLTDRCEQFKEVV